MRISKTIITSAVFAAVLTACGGGGGSGGESHSTYSITLRADKTQLPLNVSNYPVGQGVYAPFSTTLYVEAKEGGRPIPGGEKIFGCNMAGGLDSGSLYYLDGDPEHEEEVDDGNGGKIKVPNAYRSITLGSNSGGNSFHFHAKNQAGTARIVCTVTDPRDKKEHSASVDITVGGTTGKPASVSMLVPSQQSYIGTQGNATRIPSTVVMQAFVQDDAIQPVSSSSGANVQVRILPGTDAAVGARLVAGVLSGGVLQLPSIGGVAQFSLISGAETGPIFLEFTADRYDNNVGNGIQDPITIIDQIAAIEATTDPLAVSDEDLGQVTNTISYTHLLTAQGGLPPYTWSATGLPKGLSVDSGTGVLSGTPDDVERVYQATVTVRDKNKLADSGTIKLTLVGAVKPEDFAIGNCNLNQVCPLGSVPGGQNFAFAFTASVPGVTWSFAGLPSWLTSGTTGVTGFISGTPRACTNSIPATPTDPATPVDPGDTGTYTFFVTATKGVTNVTRQVSLTVTGSCS
ncbi:Ig domain-containing protein [Alicycliphilus sp. T452]